MSDRDSDDFFDLGNDSDYSGFDSEDDLPLADLVRNEDDSSSDEDLPLADLVRNIASDIIFKYNDIFI